MCGEVKPNKTRGGEKERNEVFYDYDSSEPLFMTTEVTILVPTFEAFNLTRGLIMASTCIYLSRKANGGTIDRTQVAVFRLMVFEPAKSKERRI